MKREAMIGMVLAGLALVWRMPAAGAEDLTMEAFPVSAGAVELRWNRQSNEWRLWRAWWRESWA